jgi:ribosome recycling factor
MLEDVLQESKARMQKSIESLKVGFSKIRTGRAHPSLVEDIKVSYYGQDTPIKQVANIVVEDSRTLKITPFDKSLIGAVDKAIHSSNLGLNPVTAGTDIRLPLPPLTEERRIALTKNVRAEAENARIAIRNIRRDSNNQAKEFLKEKLISEDDERKTETSVQKLTDQFIKEVEEHLKEKEKELMQF